MNVIVVCPRCGYEKLVHAHSLKWIRCPGCHRGINIAQNIIVATEKDVIPSSLRSQLGLRGGRK